MTVRQIYYKLISVGLGKSGKAFENTLSILVCEARRDGRIDPSRIVDPSREVRYSKPSNDDKDFAQNLNLRILNSIDTQFTLDIWQDQKIMPIIILEKHTLADIFEEITEPYKVPLNVNIGFTSDAKLFEISQLVPLNRELIFQMYSDYDDSGRTMVSTFANSAKHYIKNPFNVEQGALTKQQLLAFDSSGKSKFNLQTIPKTYKKRVKGTPPKWVYITKQICELDAFDPNDLKQIIKDNIERYIDNPKMFNFRIQETDRQRKNLRQIYLNSLSLLVAQMYVP
jgi:hypothetical protein